MSDDEQQRARGPLMLAATSVLKPGPTRIAKIGGNVTLPRTVPVMSLVAGVVGASIVVLLATFTIGVGMRSVILGGAFGACVGVFFVTYSPMKGESMSKWLGLQVAARRGRLMVDGRLARVYVGVCPVPDVAAGLVHVVRGAVNVPEGSVDERGVFVADAHVGLLQRLGAVESSAAVPVTVAEGMPAARTPEWAARRGHTAEAGPPTAWAQAAEEAAQPPVPAPWMNGPDLAHATSSASVQAPQAQTRTASATTSHPSATPPPAPGQLHSGPGVAQGPAPRRPAGPGSYPPGAPSR